MFYENRCGVRSLIHSAFSIYLYLISTLDAFDLQPHDRASIALSVTVESAGTCFYSAAFVHLKWSFGSFLVLVSRFALLVSRLVA